MGETGLYTTSITVLFVAIVRNAKAFLKKKSFYYLFSEVGFLFSDLDRAFVLDGRR